MDYINIMKLKKCKTCSKEFQPSSSLQTVCSLRCAIGLSKLKKKERGLKLRKISGKDEDRLRHKADKLFQIKLIRENPYSLISGKPTQVIHHWIYKSHNNNLRYYAPNGIPLTNDEHGAIHGSRPETIKNQIFIKKGVDWAKTIEKESRITRKLTAEYLQEVIKSLTSTL
jgi:hypothetical protein